MRRALYLAILALTVLGLSRPAGAQVSVGIGVGGVGIGINVGYAPPPIPDYEQPPCPQEGYMWVPGYWAWDDDDADYYWVPGTWVMAPQPGLLWTPAYWGWENGAYAFHDGYWATEVGFYGGINYGYGYGGEGFGGGRWDNGRFMYNTAVVHVNETVIHNVYVDKTVIINNNSTTRVSFNGGEGGTNARPTAREQQVAQMRHVQPAPAQMQNRQAARSNPQLRASSNQGKPPVAATAKPGDFHGSVVAAKSAGGQWKPPADRRAAAKPNNAGNNARPGMNENNRPGNQNQNARPGQVTRPGNENAKPNNQGNQYPRPGNENARPGEQQRPQARPDQAHPQQAQPQQAHPQSEKPQARPEQTPPQQAHPQQERPQARPQQEKPQQEHPQARPQQEKPQQEHPQQARPQQEKPQQEKPQREKPPEDKPQKPE